VRWSGRGPSPIPLCQCVPGELIWTILEPIMGGGTVGPPLAANGKEGGLPQTQGPLCPIAPIGHRSVPNLPLIDPRSAPDQPRFCHIWPRSAPDLPDLSQTWRNKKVVMWAPWSDALSLSLSLALSLCLNIRIHISNCIYISFLGHKNAKRSGCFGDCWTHIYIYIYMHIHCVYIYVYM
jgi:hypothetical protein